MEANRSTQFVSQVRGIGAARPSQTLGNADLVRMLTAQSVTERWIREGTGVEERCIAGENETDYRDRDTAVLFGDGAGAVVVCARDNGEEGGRILKCVTGADGQETGLGHLPAYWPSAPFDRGVEDVALPLPYLSMRGMRTFEVGVESMVRTARKLLADVSWSPEDVDLASCDQANRRTIAAVGPRLGIPTDRMNVNIDHTGNTSAAAIPIALADAHSEGRLRPGMRVLLAAFGGGATSAGTTSAGTVMTWGDVA
jgi:3-oxoacyl-[acyl-carrier-protein] synthase-3